jgi:peptidoglycan/xylan/chitin deacetylase (PgdA/CDA1 family)
MSQRASTIPVLMYHKVGQPVLSREDRFLNVPGESFRRQMRALSMLGYRARPFAEVVDALSRNASLPAYTVAITFDDGYRCIGEVAAPILHTFGFPATVFIVSQGAGRSNVWDRENGRPELPLLGWEALQELMGQGWEMGGHTRSHPHLDALPDAEALVDIRMGKEESEDRLGASLRTFCYPYGHFNAQTPTLVRAAGFLGACTTRSGLARSGSDPFLIPRVKVAYRDGVFGLLYRLLVRPHLPTLRRHRRSERDHAAPLIPFCVFPLSRIASPDPRSGWLFSPDIPGAPRRSRPWPDRDRACVPASPSPLALP